jgi:hypothetical protein
MAAAGKASSGRKREIGWVVVSRIEALEFIVGKDFLAYPEVRLVGKASR